MTGDPFAAVSVSIGRIVGVFAGVGIGIAFVHVATSAYGSRRGSPPRRHARLGRV